MEHSLDGHDITGFARIREAIRIRRRFNSSGAISIQTVKFVLKLELRNSSDLKRRASQNVDDTRRVHARARW